MTKRERMYQRIENHGRDLKSIFTIKGNLGPVELCKKLRRLEMKAHKLAEDYCNGTNGVNSENFDALAAPILAKVHEILNVSPAVSGIFLNGDARGYALKIDSETMEAEKLKWLYRDMGGNGILAPDFNND